MVAIIQKDKDKKEVLRAVAKEVLVRDIPSAKIKKTIADMRGAMESQDDAVAIAAPQIGVSLRIFVVADRAFRLSDTEPKHRVFINPTITRRSRKKLQSEEGCLSVRPLFGWVTRPEKVTVRAHDERGKPFTMGASGLLAQILQHEVDHLDGILFTDKAKDTWEHTPEVAARHGKAAA